MTNKQAIGALNRIRCIIREDSLEEQALVYAIEAIKAQGTNVGDVIHCKDCKHWKDSDGVYRRGFDAESKCPLNLKEVYEGTFFCGMAKRKE